MRVVYRHRANGASSPSFIEWTLGKGLVGQCWEQRCSQHADMAWMWFKWGDVTLSDYRQVVPGQLQYGLSHDEWIKIFSKYREALMVPIPDGEQHFAGVLAVDIQLSEDPEADAAALPLLDNGRVKSLATATAWLIGRLR